MKVQKSASVHHKTVTEFSEGKHTRRRKSGSQRKSGTLVTIKVDDRVMQVAREITAGDMRRVQILDAETVIIHNTSNWKR